MWSILLTAKQELTLDFFHVVLIVFYCILIVYYHVWMRQNPLSKLTDL